MSNESEHKNHLSMLGQSLTNDLWKIHRSLLWKEVCDGVTIKSGHQVTPVAPGVTTQHPIFEVPTALAY